MAILASSCWLCTESEPSLLWSIDEESLMQDELTFEEVRKEQVLVSDEVSSGLLESVLSLALMLELSMVQLEKLLELEIPAGRS